MLIKYSSQASFTISSGVVFHNGDEKEIDDTTGKELVSTFIGMFEDITPVKPKLKAEDKTKA